MQSEITRRCLDSLFLHTDPQRYKLVVSNNNWDPRFSHAHEMNKSLMSLDTEFLVCLDDDVVLTPGWLEALLAVAASDPSIGAVGCVHTLTDDYINHSGGTLEFSNGVIRSKQSRSPIAAVVYTTYVCSACVLFRNTSVRFDESYAKYWFETDYCYRLWENGFRVAVSPHHIQHLYGGQLRQKFNHNETQIRKVLQLDETILNGIWHASGRFDQLYHRIQDQLTHPDFKAFQQGMQDSRPGETGSPPTLPCDVATRNDDDTDPVDAVFKLMRQYAFHKIALFGAGLHTRKLLALQRIPADFQVVCVLDDNATPDSRIAGIPVLHPATATKPAFDAVVISSDTIETTLLRRAIEHGLKHVFTIYRPTPLPSAKPVSLLYVPGLRSELEFRDQHYRMAWYLNPLRAHLDRVYIPVHGPIPQHFGPLPDYLSPELPAMAANLAHHLTYFDADSPAAWDEAITSASAVVSWDDTRGTEWFFRQGRQALGGRRVYRVDPQTRRHAAFTYLTMLMELNPTAQADLAESERKFAAYAKGIAARNYTRAYVLGSGPSLEQALSSSEDFAGGYVVACNGLVRNMPLMERLQPDAFAAADMVFHSGCSAYAHEFRQALLQAIDRYQVPVFVPWRDYTVFLHNLPPKYHPFIIGVPFTHGGVPFSTDRVPNFDLHQQFNVLTVNNILTIFLLPLATTFAKNIFILGCDGRKLEDDGYFWTHHQPSQFTEHMDAARRSYPAFFAIDYNDYYLEHCAILEHYLACGEKLGYRFSNLTPSHIPALIARQARPPNTNGLPA